MKLNINKLIEEAEALVNNDQLSIAESIISPVINEFTSEDGKVFEVRCMVQLKS
jgi:hypothetical protein